jgi:hypothetical protein
MDATGLGIEGISGATEVGRTASAITYRATDDATGRAVIVKVLLRDADPAVRARFEYDQQRLVELADHPNIVTVLRYGYTTSNQPYVVNDLVEGASMAERVGSGLDGPAVLDLGIRIAGAIESAHRRDVVHGDLRPEDVRIDAQGEPEVADFGVAMATGHGPDRAVEVERLAHAAPEQLQTHIPTPASDVYALGSLLYSLLAGRPAFVRPGDTSVAAVGARIMTEPAPSLQGTGVPDPVIDAIDRAMQKDPGARWSSAEAFGLALQQAEVTLGLPITPMTVMGPDRVIERPVVAEEEAAPAAPAAPAKKSNTGLLIGIVAALVVAGIAAFLLLGGGDDDEEAGDDGRTPVTRAPEIDVDLEEVSDDTGTITVSVLETWDQRDGRLLGDDPDIVAATDSDGFLQPGGFEISGIEVTVREGVDDAAVLLEERVLGRELADECNTDREPQPEEVAGFVGLLQRFEGCDGNSLVVFAGTSGGRGLIAEVHLVEPEDEAALEDVLASITVT